ncbi:MAG TPA: nuclear transport factor 2 family protein [Sphingopyxis sp.]|jgi:steroid delta-isomerase|nr:nuclear transport factor 2 family protein [Sphingopyxis sp.]
MSVTVADKVRAVETYIAAYVAGDLDGVVSIFADDATVEDPVGTTPLVGKVAIRDFMAAGIAMGARLALLGSIRCAGDHAAFPFAVTLMHEGRETRIEVIDVFTFDAAGRVCAMQAFFGPDNIGAG